MPIQRKALSVTKLNLQNKYQCDIVISAPPPHAIFSLSDKILELLQIPFLRCLNIVLQMTLVHLIIPSSLIVGNHRYKTLQLMLVLWIEIFFAQRIFFKRRLIQILGIFFQICFFFFGFVFITKIFQFIVQIMILLFGRSFCEIPRFFSVEKCHLAAFLKYFLIPRVHIVNSLYSKIGCSPTRRLTCILMLFICQV